MIERFSEDVDLILDWRLLGYGYDEPWQARSNTKQERFKEDTLLHAELLERVVAFKEKFYRTPWARLSEAKLGTLKLAPQANRLTELDSDYRSMRSLIFGSAPRFDEVVSYMHELETIINSA